MRYFAAICLSLFATMSFADDKADLKALAGTWLVEKFEIEGSDMSDNFKDLKLVIEDGKYTVTIGNMTDSGTVSVDGSKKPKTMDVEGTEGTNKGRKYLCIYELKEGKLTICYSTEEKVRPTEFKTAK